MTSLSERTIQIFPKLAVCVHDIALVWLCWIGLHAIRYSLLDSPRVLPYFDWHTSTVLIAQALVFCWVGLYQGLWRFASLPDLVNILKSTFIGVVVIVVIFSFTRLDGVPLSVLLAYPLVLAAALAAPRLLYRAWKDYQFLHSADVVKRVLILGAGRAGEALARDLHRFSHYVPVGFLDDASHLRGAKIRGLSVLGKIEEAPIIARETAAKLLVIAMPSLAAQELQKVVNVCEQTGVPFRMVPKLVDVLQGRTLPGELKQVSIEDLLNRQPVMPDWRLISSWLHEKTVLVTGGGGSIGSEVCLQCARHGASCIVILEIDELALLTIDSELRRVFPAVQVVRVLGNCADEAVMRFALTQVKVDAVFHAAAYKQVPLLEEQLCPAVSNNILATYNVAKSCLANNVSTFVFISTDKAVEPVNVLGATKRSAEMVCQSLGAKHQGITRFLIVRFGNVLDSAGSVVPLFREQIRQGGPVTVTHPDVTRYFMTIPEACQLIIQTAASGVHGAVYTLDMGQPVPIRELAEQMILLAGKQPEKDIAIVYTGLRPGEKMHETLFYSDENYRATAYPKIFEADVRSFSHESVLNQVERLRAGVENYDIATLERVLCMLIPDFADSRRTSEVRPNTIVPFPAREVR